MNWTRRQLIRSGCAGFAGACVQQKPHHVRGGQWTGGGLASWGHQMLNAHSIQSNQSHRSEVVIVGAGISGLVCAFRLRKGGYMGKLTILEASHEIGGTAASRAGPWGNYPLGAHYLKIPNKEATYMQRILRDLGAIVGTKSGKPVYDPTFLCFAPEERLAVYGLWQSGLWPQWVAKSQDNQQLEAFEEMVFKWQHRKGQDGRPAFSIPVAHSSQDTEIRALTNISFDQWLTKQGFDSPVLRWWLEYGTRDDYGTLLQGTSAWAGLHYHCSRRPWMGRDRDVGSHILTWPGGNGWLVQRLKQHIDADWQKGSVVMALDPNLGIVQGEKLVSPGRTEAFSFQADHVVLAVPSFIADRLLKRSHQPTIESSPWVVANLHCTELPKSVGTAIAWDNVIYGAESLGYVVNTHQSLYQQNGGTLSWYYPHCDLNLAQARRAAAAWSWDSLETKILTELVEVHPNIYEVVDAIDVHIWGHGTTRPTLGLHHSEELLKRQQAIGRTQLAHSDLSGMSLFEESAYHGVKAAQAILNTPANESWL